MGNESQQRGLGRSNDERDQDEGNMNNGTLGGNMGVRGVNTETTEKNQSEEVPDGDPNSVADDTVNADDSAEGSTAENN